MGQAVSVISGAGPGGLQGSGSSASICSAMLFLLDKFDVNFNQQIRNITSAYQKQPN